jgi:hypothetical protein
MHIATVMTRSRVRSDWLVCVCVYMHKYIYIERP